MSLQAFLSGQKYLVSSKVPYVNGFVQIFSGYSSGFLLKYGGQNGAQFFGYIQASEYHFPLNGLYLLLVMFRFIFGIRAIIIVPSMNVYYMPCTLLIYSSKNPGKQELFFPLYIGSLDSQVLSQVHKGSSVQKSGYLDIALPEALPYYLTLKSKQCQLLISNIKMDFPSMCS